MLCKDQGKEVKAKKIDKRKFDDISKIKFEQKDEIKEQMTRNVISAETFEELDIDERLKKVLKDWNYEKMTNIQKTSIPVILEQNNVLVKSETGSGKTLAYWVPLIDHLAKYSRDVERISRDLGTLAIIFSPTRELWLQIEMTLKKILKPFNYIVPGNSFIFLSFLKKYDNFLLKLIFFKAIFL